MANPVKTALSIAGSDSSGGAGIQADIKTMIMNGVYAMSAVTALTAQNTTGVTGISEVTPEFLALQLDAVFTDIFPDAVKIGMVSSANLVYAIAERLKHYGAKNIVVDPVMVATSGDRLVDQHAEQAMLEFCARATVVTPNIEELAVLTGCEPATDEAQALDQASAWATDTGVSVVVKTGHLVSRWTTNTWVAPDGTRTPVYATRIESTSTHGTGCSLSSALATRLGAGDSPATALSWATDWLHEAIKHGEALHVGSGHGPVDHSYRARRLQIWTAETPAGESDLPTLVQDEIR